jgi:hypothetical protein
MEKTTIQTSIPKSKNTAETLIHSDLGEQGLGPREKGIGNLLKLGMVETAVTSDRPRKTPDDTIHRVYMIVHLDQSMITSQNS